MAKAVLFQRLPPHLRGPMAVQSAVSFLVKLFAMACGFLFAVAAARLLGPDDYGVVAVSLSIATVVATFAPLGVNGLAVREVARCAAQGDWGRLRHFVRWSAVLVLTIALAAAAILMLVAPWSGQYGLALSSAALIIPFFAGILLLKGVIQGASKPIWAQVPGDAIRWLVTLASLAIVSALTLVPTPSWVLLSYVCGCVFAFAISMIIARRMLSHMPHTTSSVPAGSWLSQSIPFLGIAVLGILGTELNTVLLGVLTSSREAGLYQPIARIAPLMLIVREAVEMPLAPRIVHDWEQGNRTGLQLQLRRAALGATAVTAVVSGAIVMSAPLILGAFGPDFVAYADVLVWIAVAQIINSATGASPLLLAMVGAMKARIAVQLLTVVVQVGLGLLLIPTIGARGAAVALVAGILTWSIAHWILAWRVTGLDSSALSAIISRLREK